MIYDVLQQLGDPERGATTRALEQTHARLSERYGVTERESFAGSAEDARWIADQALAAVHAAEQQLASVDRELPDAAARLARAAKDRRILLTIAAGILVVVLVILLGGAF